MHSHTLFCDGKNTPEEMVLSAIEKGCRTFGFSGHAWADIDGADAWCMTPAAQTEYAREVNRLKLAYADRIKILLGAEVDYFSGALNFDFDYIIGSVHAVKKDGHCFDVDNTPEILQNAVRRLYGGEAMELVKDYYELVAGVADRTECDIIGHFDLITKFNEKAPFIDTASKEYRAIALEALDALIEKDKIFEINTGAVSRGFRTSAYPEEFILRRMAEKGARVMINSDTHSAQNIMFGFEAAVEYARSCGVKKFIEF